MFSLVLLGACAAPPPHHHPGDDSADDTGTTPGTDDSGSDDTGTTPADTLDAETIAAIEAAAASALDGALATGCSVAVWRDGAIVYTAGFGTKNEAGDPVTPDTLFQIGSDTKKMTAVALLRHVDAGDFALDDSVATVLPDLSLASDSSYLPTLTFRLMLSHQSGLFDYTPWNELPADEELAGVAYGRFAENEYAMMPAGIGWSYSNPNFSLAGLATEALDSRAWPDIVIEDVARPLGMAHTWARRDDMLAAETDVASGYGEVYDAPIDTFDLLDLGPKPSIGWTLPGDQWDDAFTRPAGLVWSTASDMARLQIFLTDGDTAVLSDAMRAEIQAGQVELYPNLDPDELGYGFGLMRVRGFTDADGEFRDVVVLQHGGNTLDMTSTFAFLPDQRVGISVLSNGGGDDMGAIALAALAGAAADRLPPPSEPIVPFEDPKKDLAEYAGTFDDAVLGEVDLSLVDGNIEIDVPFLDEIGARYKRTLAPFALDMFLFTVEGGDYDLSFYPAVDGTPDSYAVNRAFVFRRVTDGKRPTPPPVAHSKEAFEAWLATHRDGPRPLRPVRPPAPRR